MEPKDDLNYIFKNELDKAVFVGDAAYFGSKDLAKWTLSDKILKNRPYKVAINPKYDGYIGELESMVYKFLDRKKIGSKCTSSRITQASGYKIQ